MLPLRNDFGFCHSTMHAKCYVYGHFKAFLGSLLRNFTLLGRVCTETHSFLYHANNFQQHVIRLQQVSNRHFNPREWD